MADNGLYVVLDAEVCHFPGFRHILGHGLFKGDSPDAVPDGQLDHGETEIGIGDKYE